MSVAEFAKVTDPMLRALKSMVRRYAISATTKAIWQLTGVRLIDGTSETIKAEAFTGIGIYARPPSGGKPEAIAVNVGGANAPVIVAVRDESTRGDVAGDVAADETMLFNSQAMVYVTDSGVVEIRSANGTAVALALKSDLQTLKTTLTGEDLAAAVAAAPVDAGASFKALFTADLAFWPEGTTVLKGE